MGTYNLNAAHAVGDSGFVNAFNQSASAINDLDGRVAANATSIASSLQPGEIAVAPNTELSLSGAGTVASPLTIGSASIIGAGRPDIPASMTSAVQAKVAAAPVGATFASTDGAAVGAWTWAKLATSWVVVSGDTGWIDLTSRVANGWSITTVKFRRINSSCIIELTNPNGVNSTSSNLLSINIPGAGIPISSGNGYPSLGVIAANNTMTSFVGTTFWSDGYNFTPRLSPAQNVNVSSGVRTITWPTSASWWTVTPS